MNFNTPQVLSLVWLKALFHGQLRDIDAGSMLVLISIFVLLFHYCGLSYFLRPTQEKSASKPVVIETLLISVKVPKPSLALTPPPPVSVIKRPVTKKTLPKPKLIAAPTQIQQHSNIALRKQTSPEPQTLSDSSLPGIISKTENESAAEPKDEFRLVDITADYEHNPKPNYPMIAKIRGWQGEVVLRVKVSEKGLSDAIEVERSSGFDVLDESAIEAVKQWLFTPARYGEVPIASAVIIPIVFALSAK